MVVTAPTSPFDSSVFDWGAPTLLEPSHQAELDGSTIHRELQDLNFYSLDGHLLYAPDLPRRNDGRLTDYWLHLYTHLDEGVGGVQDLTPWMTGRRWLGDALSPIDRARMAQRSLNQSNINTRPSWRHAFFV